VSSNWYHTLRVLEQAQGTPGPSKEAPTVVPITVTSDSEGTIVIAFARASFGGGHSPAVHVVPPGQATPHAPQFASSVCRSTQLPLHSVLLDGQDDATQLPATQFAPRPHTRPHTPQWSGFVLRSTQSVPPQSVAPTRHEHAPAEHAPRTQTRPHAPQLS
jgi:hypothetical protein